MPSSRIDELILAKEGFDPDVVAALDANDRADALSRALDINDPNRVRAIEILAPLDPANAVQAAAQLLAQGGDPAQQAAAIDAVIDAGALATPVAMTGAASGDPFVALAAWTTLQHTATNLELDALAPLAQQASGVVSEQASFAQAVIAYRAGLSGFELPVPAANELLSVDPNLEVLAIGSAAVDDIDFAKLARRSSAALYNLSLNPQVTTAIDCDGAHMLLAVDTSVLSGLPDRLMQAPALAGLIAVVDPFGVSYSVRHLVMTWPGAGGGFNVAVCEPGGAQVHFGTGTAAAGQATVALQSVVRPGAVPVDVAIVASSGGVAFTQAVSAADVSASAPKLGLEPDPDA
jgi:hypothetical protein